MRKAFPLKALFSQEEAFSRIWSERERWKDGRRLSMTHLKFHFFPPFEDPAEKLPHFFEGQR